MFDRISLPVIAGVFLRHLPLVLGVAAISAGIAYVGGQRKPLTYSSSVSFTPQERKAQISALAAQLGIGSSGNSSQSPQFYVELLNSREIRRRIAKAPYSTKPGETAPADLATTLKFPQQDPDQRVNAAMGFVARVIRTSLSPETGIISVNVTTEDPALSAQVANQSLESLDAFNRENARNLAREQRAFTQQGLDDFRSELNVAEIRLQEYLAANRNPAISPEASLQRERLTRDVALKQQMYATVVQAYQQARMEETRDAPQITVIDRAEVARAPNPRGSTSRGMLGGLLGLFLGLALVASRMAIALLREGDLGWYAQFMAARKRGLGALKTEPRT